jgi:hypothetical protein
MLHLEKEICSIYIAVIFSNSGAIQHYVVKYVSDLREVGGFLRVLLFPPLIKLTAIIYLVEYIVESGVKHHK